MKAIVSNVSSTVTKIHKNTDCDLVVMGFDGNEAVKYSKELRGETNKLKQLAAYSETVTVSSSASCPLSNASKIRSSVMIFVILAGWRTSWAFFSYKIVPVEASNKITLGAETASSVWGSV